MIDRVASQMLGELQWPPNRHQAVHVILGLGGVAVAFDLWRRAAAGKSLTLSPRMLRFVAVTSGVSALWEIWNARLWNGAPAAQTQMPAVAGYGYHIPGHVGRY